MQNFIDNGLPYVTLAAAVIGLLFALLLARREPVDLLTEQSL